MIFVILILFRVFITTTIIIIITVFLLPDLQQAGTVSHYKVNKKPQGIKMNVKIMP